MIDVIIGGAVQISERVNADTWAVERDTETLVLWRADVKVAEYGRGRWVAVRLVALEKSNEQAKLRARIKAGKKPR